MERLIAERITPVTEVEQVTLDDALGRIVAADLTATEDLPPFDNAAVDGFAVRHADLNTSADTRLVIAARVMALNDDRATPKGRLGFSRRGKPRYLLAQVGRAVELGRV